MAHFSNSISGKLQRAAGYLADWFGPVLPTAKLRERAWNLAGRRSSLSAWVRTHTVFDYDVARRFAGLRHDPHGDEVRLSIALDGNSDHWRGETPVGLSCLLDTRIYMIDQLLRDSDATSMAHSLELRTPLVDLAVANFSRSCLDDYKLARKGGSSNQYSASGAKKVLVKALEDVLPPDILTRKKRGFALPYQQWMNGPLKPLVDAACDRQTIRERGLIDPRLFDRWMQQREPGFDPYPRLWSLMILELWCRANLDAPKPAAVAV